MHMADALLSPAVGGTMMAVTIGITAYSINKIQKEPEQEESKVPLMGVMGAFVFAAQMINFSIPGTGSSGHLGGGLLLAILLGPFAGFLTMACVLFIQALFFGDGGLLAFGANVFNMGFFSCFIVYPYVYRAFIRKGITNKRILVGSVAAAVVGLQLGAFSVVLETLASGKTELPFNAFVMFMQPIHLAIGLVEGFVTAAVVGYIWNARPELIAGPAGYLEKPSAPMKRVIVVLVALVFVMGGVISLFASANPDGLEWSIGKVTGVENLQNSGPIHDFFANLQDKLTFLPDYQFRNGNQSGTLGTSFSGILGGLMTLAVAGGIALAIRSISKKSRNRRDLS
jgi:cobalt/nickel transport system permease protein